MEKTISICCFCEARDEEPCKPHCVTNKLCPDCGCMPLFERHALDCVDHLVAKYEEEQDRQYSLFDNS